MGAKYRPTIPRIARQRASNGTPLDAESTHFR